MLSSNAKFILNKRYLLKDENNNIIETPQQMFRRVASYIASGYSADMSLEDMKQLSNEYYDIMSNLLFLPNSPTLMNAGTPIKNLSACFILPVGDSIEEIFDAIKSSALINQSGGGTGFSFSSIRPKGDIVRSSNGVASGPISFMRVFNSATHSIKQGGRRKGANMAVLSVTHPDIEEFITCKNEEGALETFNITVTVTDEFMECVKLGKMFPLINPRTGKVVRHVDARALLDRIAYQAWKNGEPGIGFIDTINKYNPTPSLGRIESSNPCFTADMKILTAEGYKTFGELIKTNRGACKLRDWQNNICNGRIVYSGHKQVIGLYADGQLLLKCTPDHKLVTTNGVVMQASEMMSRPLKRYGHGYTEPIDEIRELGSADVYDFSIDNSDHLGVVEGLVVHNCGEFWALPYESCILGAINVSRLVNGNGEIDYSQLKRITTLAVKFLDTIIDMNDYVLNSIKYATQLTRKIGLGVMGFADMLVKMGIKYNSEHGLVVMRALMSKIKTYAELAATQVAIERKHDMNKQLLVIAPTGSRAMIAGCSYGIEPIAAIVYRKENILDGDSLFMVNEQFERVAKERGFYSNKLIEEIAVTGSIQDIDSIPADVKDVFVTARDISYEWHIKMQAACQEYVDGAISKTINMPEDATVEDVKRAYVLAHEMGCKSITVYRHNSRNEQVINNYMPCPECGNALVYRESCKMCMECGYSVCSL